MAIYSALCVIEAKSKQTLYIEAEDEEEAKLKIEKGLITFSELEEFKMEEFNFKVNSIKRQFNTTSREYFRKHYTGNS